MAEIKTTSLGELALLEEYTRLRNAARDAMASGVYPNCVAALEKYAALEQWLAGDGVSFASFHSETMALVLPYIAQLKQGMEAIVTTMEAIDKAAHDNDGSAIFGTYAPAEGGKDDE